MCPVVLHYCNASTKHFILLLPIFTLILILSRPTKDTTAELMNTEDVQIRELRAKNKDWGERFFGNIFGTEHFGAI